MSSRLIRSPRALSRRVGDDVIAALPGGVDIHELSGGAAAVWTELAKPRTPSEVVERLAAAHGLEVTQIDGEIRSCLDRLQALGLVEETAG